MFKTRLDWILANVDLPKSMQHWPVWKLNKLFKRRRKLNKLSNRYNKELEKWFKNNYKIVESYNQMIKDLDLNEMPF